MRLIDADKFGEDLMKLWDYSCDDGVSAIAVLKQVLLALNNAPTISPYKAIHDELYKGEAECEERTQGEWIEKEETPASVSYYCSVCKTEGIPITPFCPWCGAKMKGGAE